MSRYLGSSIHYLFLWALVTLAAWPLFVLSATSLGVWCGEARQLDAWTMEPRRELLGQFLDGWRASLIITVPVGLVAVVDYLVLSRYRITWWFGGILLPLAAIAVAFTLYATPEVALPALLITGIALAVMYRVFEFLRHRIFGAL